MAAEQEGRSNMSPNVNRRAKLAGIALGLLAAPLIPFGIGLAIDGNRAQLNDQAVTAAKAIAEPVSDQDLEHAQGVRGDFLSTVAREVITTPSLDGDGRIVFQAPPEVQQADKTIQKAELYHSALAGEQRASGVSARNTLNARLNTAGVAIGAFELGGLLLVAEIRQRRRPLQF